MEFSEKQMEKALKAKTVEELISFAKEEGITLTNDEATKYFKMLNTKEGEMAEEELDNVAGGTCYSSGVHGPEGFKKYAIVSPLNTCKLHSSESGEGGKVEWCSCCTCTHHFLGGPTWYCAIRTEDNDPAR